MTVMSPMKMFSIEQTAGNLIANDFIFKHAVLAVDLDVSTQEFADLLDELKIQLKVDFISKLMRQSLEFIHVTSVENVNSILENGLIPSKGNYVSDLGQGTYVVNEDDVKGIENLKNYVVSQYLNYDNLIFLEEEELEFLEEQEIAIIKGYYSGTIKECLWGYNHEGYIVINEVIPPEQLDVIETTVRDLIKNY